METNKSCNTDDGYVLREDICCRVVFNCPPGHEIKRCENNQEEEKCVKCSVGLHQPFHISSYHKERSCYQSEPCDSKQYITRRYKSNTFVPNHCQCNIYSCYFDLHHYCKQTEQCPINKTLNFHGVCEQCPDLHYKLQMGCGPCQMDVNKWKESLRPRHKATTSLQSTENPIRYAVVETTPQVNLNTSYSPEVGTNNVHTDILTGSVVGGISLLIFILVVIVCLCKRRKGLLKVDKKTGCGKQVEIVNSVSRLFLNVTDNCDVIPIDSIDIFEESTTTSSLKGSLFSGSSFQAANTDRQMSVESTSSCKDKVVGWKSSVSIPRSLPVASISPFKDSGHSSVKTDSISSHPGEYPIIIRKHSNSNLGTLYHNTEVKRSSFLSSQEVNKNNTEDIIPMK